LGTVQGDFTRVRSIGDAGDVCQFAADRLVDGRIYVYAGAASMPPPLAGYDRRRRSTEPSAAARNVKGKSHSVWWIDCWIVSSLLPVMRMIFWAEVSWLGPFSKLDINSLAISALAHGILSLRYINIVTTRYNKFTSVAA
jgi:hypothetical protein